MDDKKIKLMIKALKNSRALNSQDISYLVNYVTGVKNNARINDFFDVEFLNAIMLEFASGDIKLDQKVLSKEDNTVESIETESAESRLNKLIKEVSFFLPLGDKTPDYENIKAMLIVGDGFIDKELYSLFDNKFDYQQIISIIKELNCDEKTSLIIHNYALEVSPYCTNQTELKREIVSFINGIKSEVGSLEEYMNSRLVEAKKRCGIYPLDEKTLAKIDSAATKAEESIKTLENIRIRTNEYEKRVKSLTESGKSELESLAASSAQKLRDEVETARIGIVNKLDEYLLELKQMMKNSSDQVFTEMLKNTQSKLNDIRLMAQSLSTTTTSELIRIQKASEASVDALKSYVTSEPELQKVLQEAAKSGEIKEAILAYEKSKQSNNQGTPVVTSGIYIPGHDRLIVPASPDVIIPMTGIKSPILPAFDEKIPFSKRYEAILKEKERREKEGEIFHSTVNEIINCIMEGDWPYLWGPSGCGKSYLIRQIASLIGIEVADNGKITDKYSIMAYNDPQGRFRATQSFVALVYGKLLTLDEFDNGNSDTQVVLNELYSSLHDVIEKPTVERYVTFAEDMRVPVNPNFRMISAGNTNCEGENQVYSARGRIDESVQERMTPKYFGYDNRVEKRIFGNYKDWYKLFVSFREACDAYAKSEGYSSAPGMITTRDASAITKYVNHNSKSVDQIIREKFTQTKNVDYLNMICDIICRKYGIDEDCSNPLEDSRDINGKRTNCVDISKVQEKELAKCLVYGCNKAIQRMK